MEIRDWILSARPKTFTAAAIPVLVGTVLASTSGVAINWLIGLNAFICAMLIHASVNFFNDAFDVKRGADTHERLGPMRAIHLGLVTKEEMLKGGIVACILATLVAIPLFIHGGWILLPLFVLCLLCSYGYTGGSYPLAYLGLGDPFVILFYGFVITGSCYYLQTGFVDQKALLAGLQLGLLSTVIIAINNTRDIRADIKAHKMTIPARFGLVVGKLEITFCLVTPFILNFLWSSFGLPMLAFLPLCLFPLAYFILLSIWRHPPSKIYNGYFALAGILHLAFGLLMIIAIYLG